MAVFKELGLPWQTALVDPEDLEGFQLLIKNMREGSAGYDGANITIPYKEEAFRLCDELSPVAQRCGAVNTVARVGGDKLEGHNTDVGGFLDALKSGLKIDTNGLQSAIVCGTGGAARAVATALVSVGIPRLVILSRTDNRANQFVTELRQADDQTQWRSASYEDAFTVIGQEEVFDLCVNATPLGMVDGSPQELPQGWVAYLKHVRAIFDVVYRRNGLTLLVQWAHKNGIPATDGLMMLVEQAVRSLVFWGTPAEPEEMRAIMRKALIDEGITRCAQQPQQQKQKQIS